MLLPFFVEPVIIRNGISRSLCDGICRRYSGILPPMPRLYCQLKRLGVKHFRIQTSFAGLGICRRNLRDIPAGICGRPVGISRRGPAAATSKLHDSPLVTCPMSRPSSRNIPIGRLRTIEGTSDPAATAIEHMCVDLRCADILVAKQFLYRPDIVVVQ